MSAWAQRLRQIHGRPEPTYPRGTRCADCGYALVGLDVDGACPECGSTTTVVAGDATLGAADAPYLQRVQAGLAIAAATLGFGGATLALGVGGLLGAPGLDGLARPLFICASVMAGLFGAALWLVASPETGQRDAHRLAEQRATRAASILGACAAIALSVLLIEGASRPATWIALGVASGLLLVAASATVSVCGGLAARTGDEVPVDAADAAAARGSGRRGLCRPARRGMDLDMAGPAAADADRRGAAVGLTASCLHEPWAAGQRLLEHPSPPRMSAPSPAIHDADVRCAGCGYSLEGLASDVRCPECGGTVTSRSNPHSLYEAPARYLERVSTGIVMMVIAGGAACSLATVYVVNGHSGNPFLAPNPTFSLLTALVVCSFLAAGLRLFSCRERRGPGETDGAYWARVVRWASTTALVCAACFVPAIFVGFFELLVWPGVIGAAALGVAWLASMAHGAALAARTPDERLVMIFENLHSVIFVLSLVGACMFLVGPILAMATWCWVFSRLWMRVNKARRAAAA